MSPVNPDFVASEEMFLSQNVPDLLSPFVSLNLDSEFPYELLLGALSEAGLAQGIAPNSPPSTYHDQPDLPPQAAAPVDDVTRTCMAYSAPISLPPPVPQAATFPPPNWHRIPQRAYDNGQKRWNFTPQEFISFGVNGSPGMNMGDALRKRFMGLDGRDDLVLQGANRAISCRLSVRLS